MNRLCLVLMIFFFGIIGCCLSGCRNKNKASSLSADAELQPIQSKEDRVIYLGTQIRVVMNYDEPHCTLNDEIGLSFAQCEDVLQRYFDDSNNPLADILIGSSDKRSATDDVGETRFLKFVKELARREEIFVLFEPGPRGDISDELLIPQILQRLSDEVKKAK